MQTNLEAHLAPDASDTVSVLGTSDQLPVLAPNMSEDPNTTRTLIAFDTNAFVLEMRRQGWNLELELHRAITTTPHVPRSLVLPLSATIRDLSNQIVKATNRNDT